MCKIASLVGLKIMSIDDLLLADEDEQGDLPLET